MTQKGYTFLESTVRQYGHLYEEVVVGTDPSIDNDCPGEISALCRAHGIRCTPREDFQSIATEYAMAISWRWLIKHPPDRLVILHDSLLPKYRGFNPLVSSLINRETTVGVTALLGASEFDTGDILFQSSTGLTYPITIAEATSTIFGNYFAAGVFVLELIASKSDLCGTHQDASQASYSLWRDDEDYKIDWGASAEFIGRFIDAVGKPH
jgi:methionyl-tRNA formyltransferase